MSALKQVNPLSSVKKIFSHSAARQAAALSVAALFAGLAGCAQNDATIASRNLSEAADMFEINRRIVFYNGITDSYMLTLEGRCSIEVDVPKNKLDVTCKTGEKSFKKHFLGLASNISYFVEQLEGADVSTYHYRVIYKPQSIIPDIEVRGSGAELQKAVTPRVPAANIPQ